MTMLILEDVVIRKYGTGDQSFDTSWILSSDCGFATLKQVIVHEKHWKVLKKMSVFVVATLKDGTVKIDQQTMVCNGEGSWAFCTHFITLNFFFLKMELFIMLTVNN